MFGKIGASRYDSDSSTTEDNKRKRKDGLGENDEGHDKPKKSGRTVRSSPRENKKDTDMEELKGMMQVLLQKVDAIMEDQKEFKKEILELKEENRKLAGRVSTLEKRLESAEKRERKNNIKITGIECSQGKEKEEVDKLLSRKLNIIVKTIQARQIKTRNNKTLIIAKLEKWEQKSDIMKNKYKLKGSNIFVDDDLTAEEAKIQAKIRSAANQEKLKGVETKVGYQKMIKNGEVWIWDATADMLVRKEDHRITKN